jgi:hypothetical protein
MARWEQYDFYPKESVKWLKPAHNPTGLLVQELLKMKFCFKKRK